MHVSNKSKLVDYSIVLKMAVREDKNENKDKYKGWKHNIKEMKRREAVVRGHRGL